MIHRSEDIDRLIENLQRKDWHATNGERLAITQAEALLGTLAILNGADRSGVITDMQRAIERAIADAIEVVAI